MTENVENLILVQLREIRAEMAEMRGEMRVMREEMQTVGSKVDGLGVLLIALASYVHGLEVRIEKLEDLKGA